MSFDPGLVCTAIVLQVDDVPVAGVTATAGNADEPIQHRVHSMAMWAEKVARGWIHEHKIKVLNVNIETPVLNVTRKNLGKACPVCKKPFLSNERGVTTLMKQVRLLTAYEEMLYKLPCDVLLGEVHNQTAKSIFTGTGKASKVTVTGLSAWAKRPDVTDRNHLADAQAIGVVRPQRINITEDECVQRKPKYEDHAIGQGKVWRGKL